jgi:hypothetical protein
MNGAHLHLMLNHWPIFGTLFAFLLLGFARVRKSDELITVGLGLLVLVALGAIPVYLTGEPAEDAIEHLPGVSKDLIEEHEEAAEVAFVLVEILGALGLAGLFLARRSKRALPLMGTIALGLSLVVLGAMAWVGNLGGPIRHPEIRNGTAANAGNHEPGAGAPSLPEDEEDDD